MVEDEGTGNRGIEEIAAIILSEVEGSVSDLLAMTESVIPTTLRYNLHQTV